MKILSLTYEYPPIGGGGGVVAKALNEMLVAGGDRVEVVTSSMPGLADYELLNGVGVYRTPCWRRHRHYTTFLELATTLMPAYQRAIEVINKNRPDVIHAHFALPSGVVAYYLWKRFGIPYVLTAHGSDIPGYNPDRFGILHRLLKPMWSKVMRHAADVTSPSEFLAKLIRQHIDIPIRVVPNGYNPDARIKHQKRKLVLVVARLFPRKGVQHFIQSIANLRSDWEYVVAGDGPYLETLQAQARAAHVPVRFTGFIDKQTLGALYEEASILVFPSIRENFPMVLLEGMDAGCAVITTDAEGCAEVVGNAGIVIEKGSAPHIRDALVELMESPARRGELAARSRERVELFLWSRIADQYRDVFRHAMRPVASSSTATVRIIPR